MKKKSFSKASELRSQTKAFQIYKKFIKRRRSKLRRKTNNIKAFEKKPQALGT